MGSVTVVFGYVRDVVVCGATHHTFSATVCVLDTITHNIACIFTVATHMACVVLQGVVHDVHHLQAWCSHRLVSIGRMHGAHLQSAAQSLAVPTDIVLMVPSYWHSFIACVCVAGPMGSLITPCGRGV